MAHEEEYQKALVEVKKEIREKESDEIVEQMKEDIRKWFQTERQYT